MNFWIIIQKIGRISGLASFSGYDWNFQNSFINCTKLHVFTLSNCTKSGNREAPDVYLWYIPRQFVSTSLVPICVIQVFYVSLQSEFNSFFSVWQTTIFRNSCTTSRVLQMSARLPRRCLVRSSCRIFLTKTSEWRAMRPGS